MIARRYTRHSFNRWRRSPLAVLKYPGASGTARKAPGGDLSGSPTRGSASAPPEIWPDGTCEGCGAAPRQPCAADCPPPPWDQPALPASVTHDVLDDRGCPRPVTRRALIDLNAAPSAMEQTAASWGGKG